MDALARVNERFSLSAEELAFFRKNGYCGPFKLYEPDEIAKYWRAAQRDVFDRSHAVYSEASAVSAGTNISNYDRHLDIPFLADHICSEGIVGRVRSILGPDVLCWRSEFFPKYPGDEGTDWHQADTFANASGSPQIVWKENRSFGGTITVWCAFTDAKIDTGCLQFIPGTHTQMNYDESKSMGYDPGTNDHLEKAGQARGFFGYDYRELQIDPDWEPDESQAVSMELNAGEFIIFWSTLMHASHPHNGNSKKMRLGYVGRYVPTSVEVYPDTEFVTEYGGTISLDRFGCVLVAGEDEYGHNKFVTETTRGKPFYKPF